MSDQHDPQTPQAQVQIPPRLGQLVGTLMQDMGDGEDNWLAQMATMQDPDQAYRLLMEKMIIGIEQQVDATLPQTWVDYVEFIDDTDLRAKCQIVLGNDTDHERGWFALPQEGRDEIASLQVLRVMGEINQSIKEEIK